ncbi:hypothetical protein PAPYR_905 [Paratrimastix pyriformis]|uniref:C2 domain-containing protein n=1 Tax=Paratrimastix pyriformis TaxID=342808 RepID=A0ABQ8UT28_9EUKA|nr:hypothetical protein PAPYR_905 [Paratrimastix pyriformis]
MEQQQVSTPASPGEDEEEFIPMAEEEAVLEAAPIVPVAPGRSFFARKLITKEQVDQCERQKAESANLTPSIALAKEVKDSGFAVWILPILDCLCRFSAHQQKILEARLCADAPVLCASVRKPKVSFLIVPLIEPLPQAATIAAPVAKVAVPTSAAAAVVATGSLCAALDVAARVEGMKPEDEALLRMTLCALFTPLWRLEATVARREGGIPPLGVVMGRGVVHSMESVLAGAYAGPKMQGPWDRQAIAERVTAMNSVITPRRLAPSMELPAPLDVQELAVFLDALTAARDALQQAEPSPMPVRGGWLLHPTRARVWEAFARGIPSDTPPERRARLELTFSMVFDPASICPGLHLPRPPSAPASICPGLHLPRPPSAPASICPGLHLPRPPSAPASICPGLHLPRPPSAPASICPCIHVTLPPPPARADQYQTAGDLSGGAAVPTPLEAALLHIQRSFRITEGPAAARMGHLWASCAADLRLLMGLLDLSRQRLAAHAARCIFPGGMAVGLHAGGQLGAAHAQALTALWGHLYAKAEERLLLTEPQLAADASGPDAGCGKLVISGLSASGVRKCDWHSGKADPYLRLTLVPRTGAAPPPVEGDAPQMEADAPEPDPADPLGYLKPALCPRLRPVLPATARAAPAKSHLRPGAHEAAATTIAGPWLTKWKAADLNPAWAERFEVDLPRNLADCDLLLELFDRNTVQKDELIGTCTVPLDQPALTREPHVLAVSVDVVPPPPRAPGAHHEASPSPPASAAASPAPGPSGGNVALIAQYTPRAVRLETGPLRERIAKLAGLTDGTDVPHMYSRLVRGLLESENPHFAAIPAGEIALCGQRTQGLSAASQLVAREFALHYGVEPLDHQLAWTEALLFALDKVSGTPHPPGHPPVCLWGGRACSGGPRACLWGGPVLVLGGPLFVFGVACLWVPTGGAPMGWDVYPASDPTVTRLPLILEEAHGAFLAAALGGLARLLTGPSAVQPSPFQLTRARTCVAALHGALGRLLLSYQDALPGAPAKSGATGPTGSGQVLVALVDAAHQGPMLEALWPAQAARDQALAPPPGHGPRPPGHHRRVDRPLARGPPTPMGARRTVEDNMAFSKGTFLGSEETRRQQEREDQAAAPAPGGAPAPPAPRDPQEGDLARLRLNYHIAEQLCGQIKQLVRNDHLYYQRHFLPVEPKFGAFMRRVYARALVSHILETIFPAMGTLRKHFVSYCLPLYAVMYVMNGTLDELLGCEPPDEAALPAGPVALSSEGLVLPTGRVLLAPLFSQALREWLTDSAGRMNGFVETLVANDTWAPLGETRLTSSRVDLFQLCLETLDTVIVNLQWENDLPACPEYNLDPIARVACKTVARLCDQKYGFRYKDVGQEDIFDIPPELCRAANDVGEAFDEVGQILEHLVAETDFIADEEQREQFLSAPFAQTFNALNHQSEYILQIINRGVSYTFRQKLAGCLGMAFDRTRGTMRMPTLMPRKTSATLMGIRSVEQLETVITPVLEYLGAQLCTMRDHLYGNIMRTAFRGIFLATTRAIADLLLPAEDSYTLPAGLPAILAMLVEVRRPGPGPAPALPRPCPGPAPALPRPCPGPAPALPRPCPGPAPALLSPSLKEFFHSGGEGVPHDEVVELAAPLLELLKMYGAGLEECRAHLATIQDGAPSADLVMAQAGALRAALELARQGKFLTPPRECWSQPALGESERHWYFRRLVGLKERAKTACCIM